MHYKVGYIQFMIDMQKLYNILEVRVKFPKEEYNVRSMECGNTQFHGVLFKFARCLFTKPPHYVIIITPVGPQNP